MHCDRRCCELTGRWCDECWREILRGGWLTDYKEENEDAST